MSEFELKSKPALAGIVAGRFGAHPGDPGVKLTALPEGFALHLLAAPNTGDIGGPLAVALSAFGVPRYTAPGQWFLVGDEVLSASRLAEIKASLSSLVAVSDQSHGRVRVKAEGRDVLAMLAKGIGANLNETAFPVGSAATMIFGHVTVHVTRLAIDAFELMALRGFIEDLWNGLVQASMEFGVECVKA
jgi:sarcosine oxidase subunit gamma